MLLDFETRTFQMRLRSKIEGKFLTFLTSVKLGEGLAKCLVNFTRSA